MLHRARAEDPQAAVAADAPSAEQRRGLAQLLERVVRATEHDEVDVCAARLAVEIVVDAAQLSGAKV